MTIGSAMSATLPTVLVDTDAVGQAAIITWCTEAKALLEAKVATASVNIGTDQDILHGQRTLVLGACLGAATSGTPTLTGSTSQYWSAGGGTDEVIFPIPLDINRRIISVSMYGRANGATAWTFELYKFDLSTGTATQIGSTQTSAVTAAISAKTVGSLTESVGSPVYYFGLWTSGASTNRCLGVKAVFDKVANS